MFILPNYVYLYEVTRFLCGFFEFILSHQLMICKITITAENELRWLTCGAGGSTHKTEGEQWQESQQLLQSPNEDSTAGPHLLEEIKELQIIWITALPTSPKAKMIMV